jgi:hypothetical protein
MKDPKGPVKSYKSPEELAKKHNVSLETIIKQVEIGTKVEGEHTSSKSGARITALQHIDELPDYYTRLKKVEKKTMKKEEVSVKNQYEKDTKYCLLCKKNEKRDECSYGPQMWDKYTIAKIHPTNESKIHEDHKEIASGKMKDDEGYMANLEMDKMERCISILRNIIKKPEHQLPAWVQSKITRAADFIDSAAEYLSSDEMSEEYIDEKRGLWDNINARKKKGLPPKKPGEKGYPKTLDIGEGLKQAQANVGASKCWKGKKVGSPPTKMKGGKEVPNCVPAEDTCLTFSEFMAEVAAWQRKEGKSSSGGLNEKGRKSYEKENPGSDLKAPSKKVGNPRRTSFCARMSGMKKKLTSSKTANDPNSRINKSLRAWNC